MTEQQLYALRDARKSTGNLGEDFALSYERQRLTGHPQLSMVSIAGRGDIGLGYDISSFEGLTSTALDRYIEVKTYAGNPHFFLSQGEWAAAARHSTHYYLYLIDLNRMASPGYEPTIICDPVHTLATNDNWSENIQQREFTLAAQDDPLPPGFDASTILIGCFKDNPHKNWILHYRRYNVREDIARRPHQSQTNPSKGLPAPQPSPAHSPAASQGSSIPHQGSPIASNGSSIPHQGSPIASNGNSIPPQGSPIASNGSPAALAASPAALVAPGSLASNGSPVAPQGSPVGSTVGSMGVQGGLRDLAMISHRPTISGAVVADEIGLDVRYLVLYNVCQPRSYRVYTVQGASIASRDDMRRMQYPNPRCPAYVLYRLSGVVDLPGIDIMSLLRCNNDKVTRSSGTPIYISGKDFRQYLIDGTQQRLTGAPPPRYVFTNEGKPWSQNQSQRLEVLASMHRSIAEIAHELRRSPAEIHTQLQVLGIPYTTTP